MPHNSLFPSCASTSGGWILEAIRERLSVVPQETRCLNVVKHRTSWLSKAANCAETVLNLALQLPIVVCQRVRGACRKKKRKKTLLVRISGD